MSRRGPSSSEGEGDGVEVGRAGEAGDQRAAGGGVVAVDHGEAHVAHVEGDGVTEDQGLNDREADDDHAHARVAQDGAEFLAEDGEDAFPHGQARRLRGF